MKSISIISLVLPLLFNTPVMAENSIKDIDSILMQDGLSVGFHAPSTFVLDQESAKKFGMCNFYIKEGTTFTNSPAVMYGIVSHKNISGDKGIETLSEDVVKSYTKQNSKFKFEKKDSYTSKSKQIFDVRYFLDGPPPNNYEAAGYLKIGNRVAQIVYSTSKKIDFENNIKYFYEALDKMIPYSTSFPAGITCLYPSKDSSKNK
jgi:hypothetical protein